MNSTGRSSRWLFDAKDHEARELTEDDLPELQAFFEANPEYFLSTNGMPPRPDEARQEFEDRPPAGMTFDKVHVLGFADPGGRMVGMASVLCNLFAAEVWHIGLFVVDTSLHGTGAARLFYTHLEQWAKDHGAAWLRLGAVAGNGRAERFWEKVGYHEVRRREGTELGRLTHTIRVFVKPLGARGIADYLSLVPRDLPESQPATETLGITAMTIEKIYIRRASGTPQTEQESVTLVSGAGIEGDRYFDRHEEPGQNVTLVEVEEIEAFAREFGREHDLSITGRNLVTRGVRLNELVGREFTVGNVRLRGVELCEPCLGLGTALAAGELSPAAAVKRFLHRAGLRADVVSGGVIARGAAVRVVA